MPLPTASLIVTTYNRPSALDRVLDSIARQTVPPQQVIIADDGSDGRTTAVVARWRGRLGCPLLHAWQPDDGFRAGAARNRAARDATGDLLVFIDGDCLLRPSVLAEHRRLAEPGRMVAGNRILLSATLTDAIERGEADPLAWGPGHWFAALRRGDVGRLFPLLTLPGHGWRRWQSRQWLQVRTCNLSMARADFERVNGFEEEISGWGFEDSDLAIRLLNAGVRIKSGRFATAVLHLWHRERARDDAQQNRARALAAARDRIIEAGLGLRQRAAGDRFAPPDAG